MYIKNNDIYAININGNGNKKYRRENYRKR